MLLLHLYFVRDYNTRDERKNPSATKNKIKKMSNKMKFNFSYIFVMLLSLFSMFNVSLNGCRYSLSKIFTYDCCMLLLHALEFIYICQPFIFTWISIIMSTWLAIDPTNPQHKTNTQFTVAVYFDLNNCFML